MLSLRKTKGVRTMGRTEKVELTNLCLIRRGSDILLQDRVKDDWRGLALPGGHVEPGESIVDSVIREMKEETGLTIRDPKLRGLKQFPIEGGRYLVFLFEALEFDGQLHESEEGAVRWYPRDQVKDLPTVDDLEELICVIEREELSEFIYLPRDGGWAVSLR